MNIENIQSKVDEALSVTTFDVMEYAEDQPVAEDTVEVYMSVKNALKLNKLLEKRREILAERSLEDSDFEGESLSITEASKDTEVDDEINETIAELEKTKLVFKLQTVAPALQKAITQKRIATQPKDQSLEEAERYSEYTQADILSRAITGVVRGDGAVDSTPWDADRLLEFEKKVYPTQAERLIAALYEIVYVGNVFDEAVNVDF